MLRQLVVVVLESARVELLERLEQRSPVVGPNIKNSPASDRDKRYHRSLERSTGIVSEKT